MRMLGAWVAVSLVCATACGEDYRPKFDKSDYRGSVGVHLNPWFPLNKAPVHALGGPNRTWKHYEGPNLWAQGMKDILPYGVTMWEPELNEPTSWIGTWKDLIDQATSNDVPVKIGMFFGLFSKTQDESMEAFKRILGPYREILKSSPHVARAGGYPIMQIYNPKKYTPAEWGEFFRRMDAEFGRMVYLINIGEIAWLAAQGGGGDAAVDARFESLLREYLPYWDGVSSYGNGMRVPFKVLKKVMDDFPQKLYEGQAHFTYTCHFHMGGCDVHLSEDWRNHLEECLESDPDSILLTNLFDHYENSLVVPCYDREDFVLRYFEWRAEKWRKVPFRRQTHPELVVTGHTTVLLGQDIEFEVLGFPIGNKGDTVVVHLDMCDASGKVLHEFPARTMKLDTFRVEKFSVPSTDFAHVRGVVPHLRYEWIGRKLAMNYGPLTVIDPSIRGYRLYWARSTKNELETRGPTGWKMDGVAQGGTHHPQPLGVSIVSSGLEPVFGKQSDKIGSLRWGIKRDNVELYYTDAPGRSPAGELALSTPLPGSALHWYYLEMENKFGYKFQTLPVWETSGRRNRTVRLPVYTKDCTIVDCEVEEVRVPFWYYPLKSDNGKLLMDLSGWGHNGAINGRSGLGGGHLGYTGYNHYHNGSVPPVRPQDPHLYRQDTDGTGYLSFNGSNDYVIIQGGTAFPGAFTYEFRVRPQELGRREQGLVGTGNNQLAVTLMKTGRLRVSRRSANESAGGERPKTTFENAFDSTVKLETGKWARIAVVYDLRKLTLYVNGEAAGSCESKPMHGHEWLNHVILGARCGWVWNPYDNFKGDMAMIRISGRNLAPGEFLK